MKIETFFENFELLTDAPNAISKLHELILQLAVRGKLIAQNPNDEPTSILLNKIKLYKQKLINDKKIKKEQVLQPITEDEKPFIIPSNWKWVRLGDIGDWGAGATPDRSRIEYYGGSIRWFKSGELNDNYICDSEETITELALKECSLRENQPGDVLIAMYGATIGKVAILKIHATTNQAVCACTCFEDVHNLYLFLLLKAYKSRFSSQGAGGAQPNISRVKIINTVAPLPPFAEQKRIVEKCDRLLSICDEIEKRQQQRQQSLVRMNESAIAQLLSSQNPDDFRQHWRRICNNFDLLYSIPETIPQLRQAILQLAVQGKLVRQDSNDEPASVLLERIKADNLRLAAEGIIRKFELLLPVSIEDAPFDLPQGWVWARFPELGEFGRGKSKHRPRNDPKLYEDGKYPLVQTGDVARSNGVIKTYTGCYNDFGLAQSRLWSKGTLCITIAANIADTGILDFDACIPDSVVGFVPPQEIGDARYFEYFMRTAKEHLQDYAPSTAQKNINLAILEKVLIPLPPLAEQKRIVEKCDRLMSLCDTLEAKLKQGRDSSEKLMEVAAKQVLTA